MANFDQSQATRLGQRGEANNTSILMFSGAEIPEAPWPGMMIYRTDLQIIQVFTGEGFEDVVAGQYGILTFIGPEPPTSQSVGDLWFDSDDFNHLYRAASVGAYLVIPGMWEDYQDERIPQVINQLGELDGDLLQLGSDLDALNDLLGDLEGDLGTNQGVIDNLVNVVLPQLNSDIDANQDALDNLNNVVLPGINTSVEGLLQDVFAAQQDIQGLMNDLAANDAEIENLNNVILPQLQDDLEANQDALDNLNNVILPALRNDVDANQDALDQLNNVVLPAVQDTLDQVESDTSANQSALTNLNTVVLPNLQSDLTAAEETLSDAVSDIVATNVRLNSGGDVYNSIVSAATNIVGSDRIADLSLVARKFNTRQHLFY